MTQLGREQVLEQIHHRRVSAIIRTQDRQLAADAMTAAVAGGFGIVEFTLTTPDAYQLISSFCQEYDDLLVGAGTVMTTDQAEQAVAAGARFLVSPVCDPQVIAKAHDLDAVIIPGTYTPTEMNTARQQGADLVKLFPAPPDVVAHLTAILGPMPDLKIFPTAGVGISNMIEVLNAGAAGIGFVKSLFEPRDLSVKDFETIENRAATIIRRLQEWKQLTAG